MTGLQRWLFLAWQCLAMLEGPATHVEVLPKPACSTKFSSKTVPSIVFSGPKSEYRQKKVAIGGESFQKIHEETLRRPKEARYRVASFEAWTLRQKHLEPAHGFPTEIDLGAQFRCWGRRVSRLDF